MELSSTKQEIENPEFPELLSKGKAGEEDSKIKKAAGGGVCVGGGIGVPHLLQHPSAVLLAPADSSSHESNIKRQNALESITETL